LFQDVTTEQHFKSVILFLVLQLFM